LQHLDPSILEAALTGLEAQRKRIDEQIASVRSMLGKRGPGRPPASIGGDSGAQPEEKRRTMSAAARKRIAEAQRKRWQAFHKKSEQPAAAQKPAAPARKRKLSAAGRRAIIEATKKRWAAFRAGQKSSANAKKTAPKKAAAKNAAQA
jgi:hypothetical protein